MDNLGAVFGPVLALLLVSVVSVRAAILTGLAPLSCRGRAFGLRAALQSIGRLAASGGLAEPVA